MFKTTEILYSILFILIIVLIFMYNRTYINNFINNLFISKTPITTINTPIKNNILTKEESDVDFFNTEYEITENANNFIDDVLQNFN